MATLLYFGRLTDISGTSQEVVELPSQVKTTDALVAWLETERGWHGVLQDWRVRLVVNNNIQHSHTAVSNADEIGFLPPVGGG